MKRTILGIRIAIAFLASVEFLGVGRAQTPEPFSTNHPRGEFVPGVVLVKFKDDVALRSQKVGNVVATNYPEINSIFQAHNVQDAIKVFPAAGRLAQRQTFRSFAGYEFTRPSLHNIYKLALPERANLFDAIEALKQNELVEYAEPDYIFAVADTIPNDPLYGEQWSLPAIHAPAAWAVGTGDTSQIIGILDTGVDWLHPDLAAKIWMNYAELNGIAGIDDDSNGFVDDFRGWDFINADNDPRDDNSHGTHVAGISAAATNNGVGIAGVSWGAKIMPIKVFQSSGRGDVSTITQGIWYAVNKGATVLNMSFGSYSRSLTMENALAYAYGQATLVAAAGNDRLCIGPGPCPDFRTSAPFFPAALSYVLGVQATGVGDTLAGFSNCDQDGPTFSLYSDLLNYELRSPGAALMSTIPNGSYRLMSGTSMAAPVVAGAVAIYRSIFPSRSQEVMWGDFINTGTGCMNLYSAMNAHGQPRLWFVSQTIVDTLDGDRDGRVDAGETIELWFMVRNTWSQADSVFVGIRFGEFEDTTTAQIVKPTGFVGSVSAYARRSNERDPMRIHISPTVANARDIVFEGRLWYSGASDTVHQTVVLVPENGEELAGVMDSTLVLTPDKLWLVNSSFRVGAAGTLIIRPGTRLINNVGIINRGRIYATGTSDSIIRISGGTLRGNEYSTSTFAYVQFDHAHSFEREYDYPPHFEFSHCVFQDVNLGVVLFGGVILRLDNCRVTSIHAGNLFWATQASIERCVFT